MYTNCDRCKNSRFCKWADDARAFEESVKNLKHPEVVSAYFTCQEFRSKLSPEVTIKKINEELEAGKDVSTIAEEFGMSKSKVRSLTKKQ